MVFVPLSVAGAFDLGVPSEPVSSSSTLGRFGTAHPTPNVTSAAAIAAASQTPFSFFWFSIARPSGSPRVQGGCRAGSRWKLPFFDEI